MDLIDLVKNGDYLELENNLKKFIDPDYSEDGVSLLHYAVVYEKINIIKLLVEWGANMVIPPKIKGI